MTTISQTFSGSSISLMIPAGSKRTFTLFALDAQGNALFSGSATVDLTAGKAASITLPVQSNGFFITFDTNGAGILPKQNVGSGGLLTEPSGLGRADYTLTGWYTDEGIWTNSWDFGVPAATDMTLAAQWTDNHASALSLNGVSDYCTADSLASALAGNGEITIECSLTPNSLSQDQYFLAFNKSGAGNYDNGIQLGITNTGELKYYDPLDATAYNTGQTLTSSLYHVALAIDSSNNVNMYLNGVNVLSSTRPGPLAIASDDIFSIGQEWDSGPTAGNFYDGAIDDIRIWNYARSASEISNNQHIPPASPAVGLVAHYEFNPGQEIRDSSGNGHGLTDKTQKTVSFVTNGGTALSNLSVLPGEKITASLLTTRSGFILEGWYTDAGLTARWNLPTDTVTGDMTLYAKWSNAFLTTLNVGSVYSSYPSFAMEDLNNDGLLDAIAFVAASATGISTYIQGPVGTFATTQQLSTEVSTVAKSVYGTASGDLDNDGYPDFITAGPNGATDSFNAVFRNTGGIFTTTGTTTFMSNATAFYGFRAETADINGDSYDDVVWFTGNEFYVALSDGSGGFVSITTISGGYSGSVYGYEIVDADNDGNLDIVHSRSFNGDGNGAIEIFKGDGSGAFTSYTSIDQATYSSTFPVYLNPFAVKIIDLDKNGQNDMIFHNRSTDGTYGLWKGIRTSSPGTAPVYDFTQIASTYLDANLCWFIDAGDWNEDGNVDIVTSSNGGIQLFLSDGSGNLSEAVINTTTCNQALFRDVDSNGTLDIVGNVGGTIRVFYQ